MPVSKWSLPVAALGPVAAGGRCFTFRGRQFLVAIAKLTCAIDEAGGVSLASPEPLRLADRYEGTRITGASDIALALPQAEVVVMGRVRARGSEGRVGLTVRGGRGVLIDKRIRAVAGSSGDVYGTPIDFERALGGPGFDDNPLGRPLSEPPNLLHASRPEEAVGCLAPLPAGFLGRKKRLGSVRPKDLDLEHVALPDDFDWHYFQAAPGDQRTPLLAGTEQIELTGLFAEQETLRLTLPGFATAAKLYGVGDEPTLALRLEHVAIYPDQRRLELCFRGNIPTAALGAEAALAVAAAPPGHAPIFPSRGTSSFTVEPVVEAKSDEPCFASTRVVEPGEDPIAPTPFVAGSGFSSTPPASGALPGVPWPGSASYEPVPALSKERAETLDLETLRKLGGAASPRTKSALSNQTLGVVEASLDRLPSDTPFPIAEPGASQGEAAPPGAPWVSSEAPEVVAPTNDLEATVVQRSAHPDPLVASEPPPASAPATIEGPSPPAPDATDADARSEQVRAAEDARRRETAEREREQARRRFEEEQRLAAEKERRLATEAKEKRETEAKALKQGLYGSLKRRS